MAGQFSQQKVSLHVREQTKLKPVWFPHSRITVYIYCISVEYSFNASPNQWCLACASSNIYHPQWAIIYVVRAEGTYPSGLSHSCYLCLPHQANNHKLHTLYSSHNFLNNFHCSSSLHSNRSLGSRMDWSVQVSIATRTMYKGHSTQGLSSRQQPSSCSYLG